MSECIVKIHGIIKFKRQLMKKDINFAGFHI